MINSQKLLEIFFELRCYVYMGYSHILIFLMQQPYSTQATKNTRKWVGGRSLLYQKHLKVIQGMKKRKWREMKNEFFNMKEIYTSKCALDVTLVYECWFFFLSKIKKKKNNTEFIFI